MKTKTNSFPNSLNGLIKNVLDYYVYCVVINSNYKKSLSENEAYKLAQENHLNAA
ncbi:hypothetical protein [Aestuariivivens insulae]|uniref:hypothetical protein n=1 Tax=Aestuariivivens insulae TaxID=1621988 RepID=UPI001F57F297|nr:hypothetical protein [Aestuariivivens insulae]